MRKHILIVDDESHFRFSAAVALNKAGFKVSQVGSGEGALALIRRAMRKGEPYDLLLLDIQLPGMCGMELIDELKQQDISIQTLAISGFSNQKLVMELLHRGCSGFLDKPFKPKEMVKRIRDILQEYE